MLEGLNIKIISPPESINIPLKRKVLFEKHFNSLSLSRDFELLKKTILVPGEHIWTINKNSLVLERFTISKVPPKFDTESYVFLFNQKGNDLGNSIKLINYLSGLISLNGIYIGGVEGKKIICSSELEMLKKLEKYIPIKIDVIHNSINKNLSLKKASNQKLRIKELQKLHKRIVKHLEEINN